MKKGSTVTSKACEPLEGAFQPLTGDTSTLLNLSQTKTASKTSSYKDILSQPAATITHRQRLLWLLKRRTEGLWVQCNDCNCWRYLRNILDRHELPKKWYCKMNPDSAIASCSVVESPIRLHEEEDLIHSEYSCGSLVVARLPGWPWWPAMVDDCPDTEQYYWLDGFSDIPTHYNVVFFDTHDVTRAWVAPALLKPYSESIKILEKPMRTKKYRRRLEGAIAQANDAESLSLAPRLAKYSFLAKYKGTIATPKTNKYQVLKYQEYFKRKFNVDLPIELPDAEDEIISSNNKSISNIERQVKKAKKDDNNSQETNVEPSSDNSVKESLTGQVDNNSEPKDTYLIEGMNEIDTFGQKGQHNSEQGSDDFEF